MTGDELVLRAERSAARFARHWVMRQVADAGVVGASNQVIELLTGELVANAVVHGPAGGRLEVRLDVTTTMVRVAVSDAGDGVPVAGRPQPTDPGGRGLALVEALAADWGTAPVAAGGKTVWFEVDTDLE